MKRLLLAAALLLSLPAAAGAVGQFFFMTGFTFYNSTAALGGAVYTAGTPTISSSETLQLGAGDAVIFYGNSFNTTGIGATGTRQIGLQVTFADATPTAARRLFGFNNAYDETTVYTTVTLETDGDLHLHYGSTGATTHSCGITLSSSTEYFLEFQFDPDASAGSIEVFQDGSSVCSVSGVTVNTGETTLVLGDGSASDTSLITLDSLYWYGDSSTGGWFTPYGDWYVGGYYSSVASATDQGSTLDASTWDESYSANGTNPEYTASSASGHTRANSGAGIGPKGDPGIADYDTVAWGQVYMEQKRDGGGGSSHSIYYGNDVDGVTSYGWGVTTSCDYVRPASGYWYLLPSLANAAWVPEITQYAAYGMGVSGAQDLHICFARWDVLLYCSTGAGTCTAAPTTRVVVVN